MTKITFTQNNRTEFRAILHISAKYAVENDEFTVIFKRSNMRISDPDGYEQNVFVSLPYGKRVKLNYEGKYIYITVFEDRTNPLATGDQDTTYHRQLTVEYNSGADREENIRELKDYIIHCGREYYKTVLLSKKMNDKLQVYVWDDNYWDQSHKWTKRCIDSMSLNSEGKALLEDVKNFISSKSEALYERLGVPYKRNYLLHGPPGTGKTSMIRSIASELGYNVSTIHFDPSLTDIRFMRAVQTIPENSILMLEDIDHIFQERKKNDEHKNAITFSGLLQVLDGFGSQYKLITMITTNFIEVLDKALIRRGRIDKMVEFKYANRDQIHHMYQRFIPEKMEQFTDFYKHVKCLKLTTSVLQDYLFTNMDEDDITKNISELKKTVELTAYKDKSGELYT